MYFQISQMYERSPFERQLFEAITEFCHNQNGDVQATVIVLIVLIIFLHGINIMLITTM